MRNLMREYSEPAVSFKSSAKKSDSTLRYIPINLHLQVMNMTGFALSGNGVIESNYTCDFITVGAFAAHSLKFKNGGLWHHVKKIEKRFRKCTQDSSAQIQLPDDVFHSIPFYYYACA
jgi:inositol polyphosphate-4-phosphatase